MRYTVVHHRHLPPQALALAALALVSLATASVRADNPPFAVFVMRIDGSDVRKVAQVEGFDEHTSPRWSHDGSRIAFDASRGTESGRHFFIVNADGTGLRDMGKDARPDWSPDDKQLAFDVYTAAGMEIHVQNLDGQGRTKFAQGVCPRFSPDGGKLAVTDHKRLWIVDLLSGEETFLFGEPFRYLFAGYSWSPDGKWLALSVRPTESAKRQLLLVSTQGEQHGLKKLRQGEQGGAVSFSPDGKYLVFDDDYKLMTMDAAGGEPRLIPGQIGRNKDPHWSPDGRWIVFASNRHLQ
jgi:Tol biopolymer transport system component